MDGKELNAGDIPILILEWLEINPEFSSFCMQIFVLHLNTASLDIYINAIWCNEMHLLNKIIA